MPLDEYYDQDGNEQIWEVLEEVNEEREDAGLAPLTLSQEIMDATAVRANELVEYYSHTRPDGTSCFTALKNNVGYRGENIAVGYRTADDVMDGWMNSAGHRANILNANFDKLGVGYTYDSNSEWKTHWVQMFRSHEYSDDTLSHDELLNTTVVLSSNNGSNQTMTLSQLIALDSVEHVDTINTSEFYNRNKNSLVSGTSDNDTIYNDAGGVTIFGGAGSDFIFNFTLSNYTVNGDYGYVTIDGGAGNDSIDSNDPYVSINGGADNDSIDVNNWRYVTIRGGKGNDTVNNVGVKNIIQYANGDGQDVVFDFDENDTLQIVDGASYSTMISNNDVVVSIGSGSITLKDAADVSLNIVGGTNTLNTQPANSINNTVKNTLVNGTSDDDTISNSAGGVTIKAGAGDDSIYNSTRSAYTVKSSYGYVTIDAGDGNDIVDNHDPYTSINGGKGNDSIYTSSFNHLTVLGGEGNDSIYAYGILDTPHA